MLNGVEIYGEIKTAVQDYESQDFNDFGFQFGEALAKLIHGGPYLLMKIHSYTEIIK